MLCLVCLIMGLVTGAAFRVGALLPVIALVGLGSAAHFALGHVGARDAGADFLACLVATGIGYLVSSSLQHRSDEVDSGTR